jgi:hypothetical protein
MKQYQSQTEDGEIQDLIQVSNSSNNSLVKLSTADLTKVGITAQLTQTDLVEVFAEEVYSRIIGEVNGVNVFIEKINKDIGNLWDC